MRFKFSLIILTCECSCLKHTQEFTLLLLLLLTFVTEIVKVRLVLLYQADNWAKSDSGSPIFLSIHLCSFLSFIFYLAYPVVNSVVLFLISFFFLISFLAFHLFISFYFLFPFLSCLPLLFLFMLISSLFFLSHSLLSLSLCHAISFHSLSPPFA